ncbi:MAG: hypothetical protein ABIQ31_11140 [Ferruginibacter sp.]
MHKYLEMGGSGLCTFTFLQTQITPVTNLQNTQQLIIAGIIAVTSNLLIKLGTKIIDRRKVVKRVKRRLHQIINKTSV